MADTATRPVDTRELDTCPTHGADQAREYTFGMMDATVITFECGCAACYADDGLLGATLYPSYADAAGAARLIVAGSRVADRPFC
jgi:hypothetical protein